MFTEDLDRHLWQLLSERDVLEAVINALYCNHVVEHAVNDERLLVPVFVFLNVRIGLTEHPTHLYRYS